ncbi:amidohydrolase [candidate division KSB1 bacterium]|nr:amidohydrolase [candidate division KSB1 bacterium]
MFKVLIDKRIRHVRFLLFMFTLGLISKVFGVDLNPDIIMYNGRILTVDESFSIAGAVAIKNDRILAVGSNADIITLAGNSTIKMDLHGKTVIPGLIDAHLHPEDASLSELVEEIPDVHNRKELLSWIKTQAAVKKKDEWIIHPKFFPTRLQEMTWPQLKELDAAAPDNPVFLNGSYGGMINTAAMRISDITVETKHPGIFKNPDTGQPTGLINASAFSLLKINKSAQYTYEQRLDAMEKMIARYNSVGITGICSGAGNPENMRMYFDLKKSKRLTARILQNIILPLDIDSSAEEIEEKLKSLGYCTGFGDEWVRVGALKVWIDGGILTGTAYLREPWGEKGKEIYGIDDTSYRGVLLISKKALITIGSVANKLGWKFTAHCTGGGGVDLMLDAFEEVNRIRPIRDRRFSIIHGNFFTPESIERMKKLGVYADMQPAWFYKDADAMSYVLGEKRIRTFHPYKSLFDAGVIINCGSDHMVKFDSYAAINPYNPFLAMWSIITRKTEMGSVIIPGEAITRERALKMYTVNNARASFEEDIKGSIEAGKLADLVVLSDDFLHCEVDKIKTIQALLTMVGGKIVYKSGSF